MPEINAQGTLRQSLALFGRYLWPRKGRVALMLLLLLGWR